MVYVLFAYLTSRIISGAGGGNQVSKQQDLTATVMHHAGRRWLVGTVGLAVVIVGLTLVAEGVRRKFLKYPPQVPEVSAAGADEPPDTPRR